MGGYSGCRVWVDTSAVSTSSCKQYCIYVDFATERTVSDVEKHVCRVLGIYDKTVAFSSEGWLFPSSESSRVFHDDDILSIVPGNEFGSFPAKHPSEENCCSLSRTKKRKKKTSENDPNERCLSREEDIVEVQKEVTVQVPSVSKDSVPVQQGEEDAAVRHETPFNKTFVDASACTLLSASDKSEVKKKRVRRRKKGSFHPKEELPKPESSYVLHKKLQGVSHILSSLSGTNKHVYFSDDTEKVVNIHSVTDGSSQNICQMEKNSLSFGKRTELAPQDFFMKEPILPVQTIPQLNYSSPDKRSTTSPVPSVNGSVCGSGYNSAGELARLISYTEVKGTPVFERKRVCFPSPVENLGKIPASSQKPMYLNDIPVKESIIKFKVLKMVNYSPEMSREITSRVISADVISKQLQLAIIDGIEEFQEEKGKFSLEDEAAPDEIETQNIVMLNWNEILEPQKLQ